MIKYASNAFLATKISYINEIANLCEKAEVDIKDISSGMGLDQRIGERFLRAGPAYGGSCFPKDTRALVNTGDKYNVNLSIVKSVIKSNENRKNILLKRVHKIIGKNIRNKKIIFLGVTFKPGTDDMREASSLKMIPYLTKNGAFINYTDPSGPKKILDKHSIGVAHHKVINLISLYDGITISELLKKLKITKQSLNRVLKDLIKMEVIDFKKNKKDTRLKHVHLNEKGVNLFNEIFNVQKKRIYKALLNSSSKEVINFNNVLNKIINGKI